MAEKKELAEVASSLSEKIGNLAIKEADEFQTPLAFLDLTEEQLTRLDRARTLAHQQALLN